MANKYSPVKIQDPCTDNHLVRLFPKQEFHIELSPHYGDADIDFDSRYFSFRQENQSSTGARIFQFVQNYDLTFWNSISTLYLGEVLLVSEETVASLCVFLESRNPHKVDVVTVINPGSHEVKLDAHQIIEIVLYDQNVVLPEDWRCQIFPGYDGLGYEQIGSEVFSSGTNPSHCIDDIYCLTPRSVTAVGETLCLEKHYWFRCRSKMGLLTSMPNGVYSGGKLVFSGGYGNEISHTINVKIRVRERDRPKIYKSMLCPRKGHGLAILQPNKTAVPRLLKRQDHHSSPYRMYKEKVILKKKDEVSSLGIDHGCKVHYCKKPKIRY